MEELEKILKIQRRRRVRLERIGQEFEGNSNLFNGWFWAYINNVESDVDVIKHFSKGGENSGL